MKKRHILLIMIFGIHFPPETSSYGFRPTYILLEFFFNYSLNFIRHIMLTFGSKFYFWLLVYISKVLSFFCLFVCFLCFAATDVFNVLKHGPAPLPLSYCIHSRKLRKNEAYLHILHILHKESHIRICIY